MLREQRRQDGTGRDTAAALLLLRRTTVDIRVRDEKGLERLRAWCLICREPCGLFANDALVTEDWPHLRARLGAVAARWGASSFSPAVPPACHKHRA
jgi:hypothetical protein